MKYLKLFESSSEDIKIQILKLFSDLKKVPHPYDPEDTSIYLNDKGVIIMEIDDSGVTIDYKKIWSVFENTFDMDEFDIKKLISSWLKSDFDISISLNNIVPSSFSDVQHWIEIEEKL